jgi:tRNA pseudouridine13 synthase
VPYLLGEFVFYRQLPVEALESLKGLSIPFMTHRTVFNDGAIRQIFEEILKEEGIAQEDFRIRGMVKTYFRKGERRTIIFPDKLVITAAASDELNKGKHKMTVSFEIPRGAYATILIKRISYGFFNNKHLTAFSPQRRRERKEMSVIIKLYSLG